MVKDESQATIPAMINVNGAHETLQVGHSVGQHRVTTINFSEGGAAQAPPCGGPELKPPGGTGRLNQVLQVTLPIRTRGR
jgi:hypothetical protein